MNRKEIRCEIDKLAELVEGWGTSGPIPVLERDLAMEKLLRLYEAIRFCSVDAAAEESHAAMAPAAVANLAETVDEPTVAQTAAEVSEAVVAGELPDLDELLEFGPQTAGGTETEVETEADAECDAESVAAPESESAVETDPVAVVPEPESVAEANPVAASEPEPAAEPVAVPEPESIAAPESVATPDVESAATPESKNLQTDQTLFGVDDEILRHRRKQRVIMSLYDAPDSDPMPRREPFAELPAEDRFTNHTAAEPVVSPRPSERSAAEGEAETKTETLSSFETHSVEAPAARIAPVASATPGAVLGDVINHDVQTLADTIAPPRDAASELRRQEPVDDLRRAVGINDKFLMIRDLFDGDRPAYDQAIAALNACESLDDCMIYIAENYAWNPDSDGARLLMGLLERKFS